MFVGRLIYGPDRLYFILSALGVVGAISLARFPAAFFLSLISWNFMFLFLRRWSIILGVHHARAPPRRHSAPGLSHRLHSHLCHPVRIPSLLCCFLHA